MLGKKGMRQRLLSSEEGVKRRSVNFILLLLSENGEVMESGVRPDD